jgi:endo-1,4-beta-xylanase
MSRMTKQYLCGVCSLVVMMLFFTAGKLTAQIVTNGGFENSSVGDITATGTQGWVIQVADTATPKPLVKIVSDTVEQGSRALMVVVYNVTAGANQWDIQVIADSIYVVPGIPYNYSIWAKSSKAGASVNFTTWSQGGGEYGAIRPATLTTKWQQFNFQFTVSDTTRYIRGPIHFDYSANKGDTIWIDNLQIWDPNASKRPLVVEGESGVLGSNFPVLQDSGVTYVDVNSNPVNSGNPGDTSRMATYQLQFPDSGAYNLFARVRVDSGNGSFFYGNGFGMKSDTANGDWVAVSGLDSAGFSSPTAFVDGHGTLGTGVWKWVNLTKNAYQGENGNPFVVSIDSLTRTFQIGGGGQGLDIDKLAFGKANLHFTVSNLDKGGIGVKDTATVYNGPPLATGQGKFLGNADDSPDSGYANYWNQITPGNAGKWGSIGNSQDTTQWNWSGLDRVYNYALGHHQVFKDHNLIWGAQQPSWISSLDSATQYHYIETWIRQVGQRYPQMNMVDVVNECLAGHNPPDGGNGRANYEKALGGQGKTGWDWVITAFTLARKYMPSTAKLLINDYGIINDNSATTSYLQIINLLKQQNLIDGIGVQCHNFEIETADTATLRNNLNRLAATGLPIYISEMDLGNVGDTGTPDDNVQLQAYQKIFPMFWNFPAIKGITLWGYKEGQMWQPTCYLVRSDGTARPALSWMINYIKGHPVGVEQPVSTVPTNFLLAQNYPNPFNPTTTIGYQLPASGHVTLKVYDVLGRVVETLVDGKQNAGYYNVKFDASRFASGVYFYELRTDHSSSFKKMLLLK